MSYILDALRRADAEREREAGAVPTLRTPARPVMEHEDDVASAGGARPAWLLPAAGVGLLLAGAAVYALLGSPSPAPPAPPAGLSSGATVPMPLPALPGAPGPAGTPSTALPMPMPKPLPPPGPASPAPRATVTPPPKPTGLPGTTAKAPVGSPAAAVAAAAPVARPTAAPGVAASAPTTAKRALKLAELPDTLRRELPPLAIAGSMHSPERAGRMLILNGQVRREGDAVAPGLVLEEIGAKSAIFGFKGQRIEIPL